MLLNGFVDKGTDGKILKSLPIEEVSEDLVKAMGRQGLVQKDVTVKGKNGQTFTRKQWVRASEAQAGDKPKAAQPDSNDGTKQPTGNSSGDSPFSEDNTEDISLGEFLEDMDEDSDIAVACKDAGLSDGVIVSSDTVDDPDDISKFLESAKKLKSVNDGTDVYEKNGKKFVYHAENGSEAIYMDKSSLSGGSDAGNTSGDTDKGSDKGFAAPGGSDNPKASIVSMLTSGKSRDDILSHYEAAGVTWKHNDHPAINWMRANMAIQKHLSGGTPTNLDEKQSSSSEDRVFLKTPAGSSQSDMFKEAREFFKQNSETVETAKTKVKTVSDKKSAASLFANNFMLSGGLVSEGANGKTFYGKISDSILQDVMSTIEVTDDIEVISGKDSKTIGELRPYLSEINTVLDVGYNNKPIVVCDGSGYLGDKLATISSNGQTYDIYSGPNSGNSPNHVVAVNKSAPKRLGNFRKNLQVQLCSQSMFKDGITTQSKAATALTKMGLDWDKNSLENYAKEYTPNQANDFVEKLYSHWNLSPTQIKSEVNKAKEELQVRDWLLGKLLKNGGK